MEAIYPEPQLFRESTSTLKLPGRRVLTSRDDSPCRTMKEFLCDYNVPFSLWGLVYASVTTSTNRHKKGKHEQKDPREVKMQTLSQVNDQEAEREPTNYNHSRHSLELQEAKNVLPVPHRSPYCMKSGKAIPSSSYL